MWPFKSHEKTKITELNVPNSILESMKILEMKGIRIKTIETPKELADRMRVNRENIDTAYKKDSLLLLKMNTEFACFLDKKEIPQNILKSKPEHFIGMMFGIDIIEGK